MTDTKTGTMTLNRHKQKVAVFIGAIASELLSVSEIKRFVAGAKADPCPSQKTLDAIAAAEEALARWSMSAQRAKAQRVN